MVQEDSHRAPSQEEDRRNSHHSTHGSCSVFLSPEEVGTNLSVYRRDCPYRMLDGGRIGIGRTVARSSATVSLGVK